MKQESGRSLVELIGVMAIGAAMMAGAVAMYSSIRKGQLRTIAAAQLEQITSDTKLLMGMRGTYNGLSVQYLIDSGALANTDAPIGDDTWSIGPTLDGLGFEIKLNGLSFDDCAYFTTAIPKWTTSVVVNGVAENPQAGCFSSQTNQLTFVVQ